MESNHNEIEEIVTQKKVYELRVYPSNSRDQNNLSKPENFLQKHNDENKVKEKANHETIKKKVEQQKDDFSLNIRLFKKFEGSLLSFLKYSSIGGLSELGKRKELSLRIFWMIVVFICSSYAVVTFIAKVNLFYNYKVNLVFGRYQEMPTKFPAITICNQNPFNEQFAFKYIKDKFNYNADYGIYNADPEYIFDAELMQFFFESYGHKQTVNILKRALINDINQTDLSNISYDLDTDMLISCQYNGHLCSETNGHFKRFWNNIYGNCYTFNNGNNSYLTGNQHGLHLEMIVGKLNKKFKIFYLIF
jgi:hypothetical protein